MAYRRNPILGALRTYNSAMYAARATTAAIRRIKTRVRDHINKPKTSVVARVRTKTRGALNSNPRAYDRSTMAGQKRRDDLAKKISASRTIGVNRTKRRFQGMSGAAFSKTLGKGPLQRTPYQGFRLKQGMTPRELNRKVLVHATKKLSHDTLRSANVGGDRKKAAAALRAMRSGGGQGMKGQNTARTLLQGHFKHYQRKAYQQYRQEFMRK